MAFKMNKNKAGSLYKKSVYKNSTVYKKTDEEKHKHAGGVLGGKTREGEVTTNQKSVAIRRINAMDATPEQKRLMIEELTKGLQGGSSKTTRTTGVGK